MRQRERGPPRIANQLIDQPRLLYVNHHRKCGPPDPDESSAVTAAGEILRGMESLPPAGWYKAPGAADQLRYWDGDRWTDHIAEPSRPADTRATATIVVSILIVVLALGAAAFLFLLTLLSANACGPFADGCDDYGETAPGFGMFAVGTVLAITVAAVALAVAVTTAWRRRRRRMPKRPAPVDTAG